MPAPLYTVPASAVSLTASTAKSVLGAKAHANSGLLLRKVRVSFNSVTAADQPVLVEVMSSSWATNSPGTNSTSVTPSQPAGRIMTVQFTAAKTWTSEPTALTLLDNWYCPAQSGVIYDFPLSDEFDFDVSTGPVIRCTPGASATSLSYTGALYLNRC